jgi:hypothetical protein
VRDLSLYFRTRLVEVWDEHSVGSAAIDDDLYVQWSAQSPGLQIECVSNRFLPADRQLSFEQRRRLQEAGWQSPGGEDLPNYWQRFTDREQLDLAVAALVDAVDILRLGLPSSDPTPQPAAAHLPAVPTPTPARQQRPPGERRTSIVVPVYKSGTELVTWAARALLKRTTVPTTLVDLLGVSNDDLPPGRLVRGLGGAGLHSGEHLVIARPQAPLDSGLATWLRTSADLLGVVEAARARGREVVVLAPWLLDRDPWLYAGVVRELANELVLCVEDDGHGYVQEVALPVVSAPGCPAPIVLLGQHAAGLDRLTARAAAALGVHDPEDRVAARSFQVLLDTGTTEVDPDDPDVAERVAHARNASLQSRFRLLVVHDLPEGQQASEALSLLDDLAVRVTTTGSDLVREEAVRLLGGMVVRLGYWVDPKSAAAEPRLQAVANRLMQTEEWADLGRRLLEFVEGSTEEPDVAPRGSAGRHTDERIEHVEAQMHYLGPGTTCHSKAQFAALLEDWLEHDDRETTIGQPSSFGGKALVHVVFGDHRFHLNGDTRDHGVRDYLDLVRREGPEPRWHVVANQAGKVNKVAFGDPPAAVKYFYLYASDDAAAPYTV